MDEYWNVVYIDGNGNKTIKLYPEYNDTLTKEYLEYLSNFQIIFFGWSFNQPIDNPLFKNLNAKKMVFGNNFNQSIGKNNYSYLPNCVEILCFGDNFNQPVNNFLHDGIKYLKFGKKFEQDISNLPVSIENLILDK